MAVEPSRVIPPSISRSDFPNNFIFGTASSAYQYEGAADKDGRGPSIWDTLTHDHPDEIDDKSNGDKAVEFYYHYKDDVKLMEEMGMDAFRFSISWSRLLPNGRPGVNDVGVNEKGVQFYNNLIDELLSKGLKPFVTIFHWDLPQALEDEYDGFLSDKIVKDFHEFANLCFKKFGDKVKHWITINEPWSYSKTYAKQTPGSALVSRCSPLVPVLQRRNKVKKDPSTDPYTVAHHMLLSHAEVVKLYKDKYQTSQEGKIGITLVCNWMVPYSNTDQLAAGRALDFMLGWFMDPLTDGDYPPTMRTLLKKRLPEFTKEQSKMMKGSFDFIGMNYYTAHYAADDSTEEDSHVKISTERDDIPIGPPAASSWLHFYSNGFQDLLVHIKKKYKNPTLYITENGIDEFRNSNLLLKRALHDSMRIYYHHHHLLSLKRAINVERVNVKGYFAWSLLDNFEWRSGYTVRFGLYFVDYGNHLKRHSKKSATWFKKFLKG